MNRPAHTKAVCLLAAMAGILTPSLALAHPGHEIAEGFAHGFVHPLLGLDHVLAMIGVGLLAVVLGGRALIALPLTFVSLMALGGFLGQAGLVLPAVETGIALSLVVFGAALALGLQAPVWLAMAMTGIFALFHGFAHGLEMPATASGLTYGAGFVLATLVLHGAGLGLGLSASRLASRQHTLFRRLSGLGIAATGMLFLSGLA